MRAGLARTRVLSGVADGLKRKVDAVRRAVMAVERVSFEDGDEADVKNPDKSVLSLWLHQHIGAPALETTDKKYTREFCLSNALL